MILSLLQPPTSPYHNPLATTTTTHTPLTHLFLPMEESHSRGPRKLILDVILSEGTAKCLEHRVRVETVRTTHICADLCNKCRMTWWQMVFLVSTVPPDPTHTTASLIAPSSNLRSSDLSPQNDRNSTACTHSGQCMHCQQIS